MKYRVAQYAQALHVVLKGKAVLEQKQIMRRFAAMLTRHRMIGKSDLIIAAYEKLVQEENGVRKIRIEAASPVTEKLKKEISEILGKKIYLEEQTNINILAGIKILVDGELLIDASGKRQIEKIFQHC